MDILPTVLDALGLPVPAGLPGRSLLAVAEGRRRGSAPPSYFEALTPALTRGWAPIHGVLRDRLKYLDLPLPELYDLARRPSRADEPRRASGRPRSRRCGRSSAASGRATPAPPARPRPPRCGSGWRAWATWERGRGLAPHYGEDDDPKRNVAFENGLRAGHRRYVEGDVAGALARASRSSGKPARPPGSAAPLFPPAPGGRPGGSSRSRRAALAADPGSVEAAAELGRLLDELGRPQETGPSWHPSAGPERGPRRAHDLRDRAGADGPAGPAVAALQRARRAILRARSPPSASVPLHLLFGDQGRAREAFLAASRSTPRWRAPTTRSGSSPRSGRPEEAARLWDAGPASTPDDPDTLFNLGTLLWREGRRDEARPALERFLAVAPPARYAEDLARFGPSSAR